MVLWRCSWTLKYMGCYDEILGLGMAICWNFCRFFEDLLAMCKTPGDSVG